MLFLLLPHRINVFHDQVAVVELELLLGLDILIPSRAVKLLLLTETVRVVAIDLMDYERPSLKHLHLLIGRGLQIHQQLN